MKKTLAFVIAFGLFTAAAHPVLADDQAVAWTACYKELTNREGLDGNLVKKFHINKIGPGQYEVTGLTATGQSVSCKTKDGKAKWVVIR